MALGTGLRTIDEIGEMEEGGEERWKKCLLLKKENSMVSYTVRTEEIVSKIL